MTTRRRLRELREPDALRLLVWSLLTILKAEYLLRSSNLTNLLHRFDQGLSLAKASRETTLGPDDTSLERVRRHSNFIVTTLLRSRRPCLLRCLVLYRYCRARSMPVSIHFGVRPVAHALEGAIAGSLSATPPCSNQRTRCSPIRPFTPILKMNRGPIFSRIWQLWGNRDRVLGRKSCLAMPVMGQWYLDHYVSIKRQRLQAIWRTGFQRYRAPSLPAACYSCRYFHACGGGTYAMRVGDRHCLKPLWEGGDQ